MPAKKADDDQPRIDVRSYNQQGGITAGVVNIQTDPEPEIELSELSEQKMDSGYLYEAILTIQTRYVIPQLRVTAHADSIESLDIMPQRGGIDMGGNAGKREGFHFETLQYAAGKYKIRVVTARQEPVRIDLEE